jgi:hypothetical protein
VLSGRSIDHVAIPFDGQGTQDSVDDMILYWWTNDMRLRRDRGLGRQLKAVFTYTGSQERTRFTASGADNHESHCEQWEKLLSEYTYTRLFGITCCVL